MMFVKWLFLFLCLFPMKCESKINDCAQIYFAPILSENFLEKFENNTYSEGSFSIGYFERNCGRVAKSRRKIINLFNFVNQSSEICLSLNTLPCDRQLMESPLGILQELKTYQIKNQLHNQIEQDQKQNCFRNSLAIFITDIYCRDFEKYPDVYALFGRKNFNKTMLYLTENKLQTLFMWLGNSTQFDPYEEMTCDYMRDLKFNYYTNYFEIRTANYTNLILSDIGNLCSIEMPEPEEEYHQKGMSKSLERALIVTCSILFGFIVVFVCFWGYQIRRRWMESKVEAFACKHTNNTRHILFGNYRDEWEVTPRELKVDASKVIGYGFSGKVYKGHLKKKRNNECIEMDVAVKFAHGHATEAMRQDMIKEIGFMKALGSHENLLVMVGYVKSLENPVIATHYCAHGDLHKLLRKHPLHFMSAQKCQEVEVCLLLTDLLRIALQVCNGLIYLTQMSYVHRDVAARNVLLTENLTAKLGDFGLCRMTDEALYVQKGDRLPIKNLPFEALKFGQFSEKSDVWSFGILMFEMLTGGEKPFNEIEVKDFADHLEMDGRPELPQDTPYQLSQILNFDCFQKDPKQRATFNELKEDLNQFYLIVLQVLQQQK